MYFGCIITLVALQPVTTIIVSSTQVDPGLKTRITQAGLNYATKVAVDIVSPKLYGKLLPNQNGKSGRVTYWLSNLKITNFAKPTSSVSINPPTGLRWTANRIGLSVTGKWSYTWKGWWFIKVSDSGTFDVSVHGVSFVLTTTLGKDDKGKPSISSSSCSCTIESVEVHFKTSWLSWLYNLFRGPIARKIRDRILRPKMCSVIRSLVDVNASNELKKLPLTMRINDDFMLDYRLVSSPLFKSSYIETYHKGEILWSGDMSGTPVPVPALPEIDREKNMFYVQLSDYILNTLAYQAQKHDYLKYNITAKDIPASMKGVLESSCKYSIGICIGSFIPQIAEKYPDRQVVLRLKSERTPVIRTVSNSIEVLGSSLLDLYAAGNSSDHLVSLNASIYMTATLSLKNNTIYGKVKKLDFKISVLESAVGDVNEYTLQFVADNAVKLFLEPKLNALGRKGFPLPTVKSARFVNSRLTMLENSMIAALDIEYLQG